MEEENKQPSNYNNGIKVIHTYTSDMADAVRENEMSVIKIALAEKEKREREDAFKKSQGTGIGKLGLVIGSLLLIGIAFFVMYFVLQKKNISNAPQQVVKDIEAIISYDSKVFIDTKDMGSQIELSDAIKKEVANTGKPRSIKSIFLTQNITGKTELLPLYNFVSLLEISAPQVFVRSLNDSYMIGTYLPIETADKPIDGQNTSQTVSPAKAHLFFILKTKDYNQAYASMLTWEKTMLNDMFIPFDIDVSGDRSTLFDKQWSDIIINNKDARVLLDDFGNSILYYMFLDKETLIITDNEDTIKEVSARLLAKKTKPL